MGPPHDCSGRGWRTASQVRITTVLCNGCSVLCCLVWCSPVVSCPVLCNGCAVLCVGCGVGWMGKVKREVVLWLPVWGWVYIGLWVIAWRDICVCM